MDTSDKRVTKQEQRKISKLQRDTLSNRDKLDKLILDRVCALLDSICHENTIVGLYINRGSEVCTARIISHLRNRVEIALPKIIDNDIVFSLIDSKEDLDKILIMNKKYKIMEPNEINICDPNIIIAPMVAFDERLARLGYGGGFYDRYLIKKDVYKIGIAYDAQKVDQISANKNDVSMDIILSDFNTYTL